LAWTIEFEQDAIRQLNPLDRVVRQRIVDYLEGRVAGSGDPRQLGKPFARRQDVFSRIVSATTGQSAFWSTSGW
jgi:hypothetical protein